MDLFKEWGGFILLFFMWLGQSTAQEVQLHETNDFGTNPGNLEMFSYSPSELSDEKLPLVVVLHGCTQSAKEVALQTGWNKLADSLRFFVVYPQTNFSNNISKCFRWFSETDIATQQGECASVHQMITHFLQQHPVDSSRLYITGLSAGGALAVAMLARYSDLFASGAIVAGGPYGAAWNIKSAKKAMRGKVEHTPQEWAEMVQSQNPNFKSTYPTISVYHGTKDKTVRPINAEHLIAQWTYLHGTDISPDSILESYGGHPQIKLQLYSNAQGEEIARYYVLSDVQHTLSIATGDAIDQGGKTGRYTINTGFHIPWQCAVDFGLTKHR